MSRIVGASSGWIHIHMLGFPAMIRLIVVASLLVGCRISLEDEPAPGNCVVSTAQACLDAEGKSNLAWIETNIFAPSCNFSGCHGANGADSSIILAPGRSHQSLVDNMSSVSPGRKGVVPNDVNASLLMLMLGYVSPADASPAASAIPGPGAMPLGGETLCCQKLQAIERWIEAGAPNN